MIPYPGTLFFIDGIWQVAADGSVFPAPIQATASQIGTVAQATRADVGAALDAAELAFADGHK